MSRLGSNSWVRGILSVMWGFGAASLGGHFFPLKYLGLDIVFASLLGTLVTGGIFGWPALKKNLGTAVNLASRKLVLLREISYPRLRLIMAGATLLVGSTAYFVWPWLGYTLNHPDFNKRFEGVLGGGYFLYLLLGLACLSSVFKISMLKADNKSEPKIQGALVLVVLAVYPIFMVAFVLAMLGMVLFVIGAVIYAVVKCLSYIPKAASWVYNAVKEIGMFLLSLIKNLWFFVNSDDLVTYSTYALVLSGASYWNFSVRLSYDLVLTTTCGCLSGLLVGLVHIGLKKLVSVSKATNLVIP